MINDQAFFSDIFGFFIIFLEVYVGIFFSFFAILLQSLISASFQLSIILSHKNQAQRGNIPISMRDNCFVLGKNYLLLRDVSFDFCGM